MENNRIEALLQRGIEFHENRQFIEAEACYKEVLGIDSSNADAIHLLGLLADSIGDKELAVELIGHAIAADPSSALFHNNLANILKNRGNTELAIAGYLEAIRLNPAYSDAFFNLGTLYQGQGSLHKAVQFYQQAVSINPDFVQAWINLADVLHKSEQFEEAAFCHKQHRELKSADSTMLALQGRQLVAPGIESCAIDHSRIDSTSIAKRTTAKRSCIAVLDNYFPSLLSAFRIAEFNHYLEHFPQLVVYSTVPNFDVLHAEYSLLYPQYADRVRPYDETSLHICMLVYMTFLCNAYDFLPALTAHRIPFIFTLYPGGSFWLDEPTSDKMLDQVLSSSLIRGVIATQSNTLNYLHSRNCSAPIYDIYGMVCHPAYFENMPRNERVYHDALNICFVAAKYMPQGEDKGYPEFIQAAERLALEFPHLRFSVVGNYDASDFPLHDQLASVLSFKGLLTTHQMKEFLVTQHIILSPNRPFLLKPGKFDGFPTGCCVEASLCGVAIVCSDVLKLNRFYTDGIDIVICEPEIDAIVNSVRKLVRNPELLRAISEQGQCTSQQLFDPHTQLSRRTELLSAIMEEDSNHLR